MVRAHVDHGAEIQQRQFLGHVVLDETNDVLKRRPVQASRRTLLDRSSVRVDEGHAGWAAVDVEVDQLPRVAGQAAVKIIAEQVGDPPALDLGWSPGARDSLTTQGSCPPSSVSLHQACRTAA